MHLGSYCSLFNLYCCEPCVAFCTAEDKTLSANVLGCKFRLVCVDSQLRDPAG